MDEATAAKIRAENDEWLARVQRKQELDALRANGQAVSNDLQDLNAQSAAITVVADPGTAMMGGMLVVAIASRLAWCNSEQGQSYRQMLGPDERPRGTHGSGPRRAKSSASIC